MKKLKNYKYTMGAAIIMCVLLALGVVTELLLHNHVALTAIIFIAVLGAILVLRVFYAERYMNGKLGIE